MKITKIESFAKSQVGLVRLTTESGDSGWGQIASFEAADIVALCLHRQVAPVVLGRDSENGEAVVDAVLRSTGKFPGSYVCRAMAAVDTALLDLRAKERNQGVCEMLGGRRRPVPVYGSSMSRSISAKEEATRMVRLRDEAGLRAFKVRVGGHEEIDVDVWSGRSEEIIGEVRDALGDDVVIHADANGAFSPHRALQIGRLLEDEGYGHFEEPCPYWEYDWTRLVTEKLRIPVAGGEQDNYFPAWKYMIRDHVVDIVQPDVCYVGGVTRARAVAGFAAEFGMQCTPHAANHSLVTVFTLHLALVMPNAGPFMEFSIEDQKQYDDMYAPRLEVHDGAVVIPSESDGWGVVIREEWLGNAEYRCSQLDYSR